VAQKYWNRTVWFYFII